ncbi:MAG: hypothetical protein HOW73_06315 [Polyangiaceae bacterium]|nr:hypothetical protein [Polyangiaceae bacterium]
MKAGRGAGLALGSALGTLVSLLGDAHAQPATPAAAPMVTLKLDAPEGCSSQSFVDGELERLLGDALRRGVPLDARADVAQIREGQYRLLLRIDRAGSVSSRELEAKNCATLAEVAALLTALSHDPEAVDRARAREAAPVVAQPAEPAPPISPPVAVAPKPPQQAPFVYVPPLSPPPAGELGFAARLGPMFGIADLPDPHAGVSAAVGIRIDAYLVEGAFEMGIGSTGTLDGRPAAGADFMRITGIVRGCRVVVPFFHSTFPRGPGDIDFSACVGIELGVMSGEGFGVTKPERGEAFWAAPRVDGRLSVGVFGPLSAGAEVGVAFPVDPRRFIIHGVAEDILVVHQPGPVAGRLGIALELQL